jgi:hypothetical protein
MNVYNESISELTDMIEPYTKDVSEYISKCEEIDEDLLLMQNLSKEM